MLQTIIDAIHNRESLAFNYSGISRVVEPHAVGMSTAGHKVLRCYQTHGSHVTPGHEWDLCDLSKIVGLRKSGSVFANARSGYKQGDRGMTTIYAEL